MTECVRHVWLTLSQINNCHRKMTVLRNLVFSDRLLRPQHWQLDSLSSSTLMPLNLLHESMIKRIRFCLQGLTCWFADHTWSMSLSSAVKTREKATHTLRNTIDTAQKRNHK